MIRLKFWTIILLVLSVFSDCKKNQELCCVELPKPLGTYIYPVGIGNPDWNVYQIPDSILIKMPTPTLIQSLLDNPNIPLMNIYSSEFQGRDRVLKNLNASYELNKRQDACQKLFERYLQMTPCCFPQNGTLLEQGVYIESWGRL